jgi:hypothetical protein
MARKAAKKSRKRTTSKARKPNAKPSPEHKVTGPYSPEQRTAIVEQVRARHSPVTIHGPIERPDFHVTTDIRATSDPLWRHLAAFRRRLIEGGTFTPANWQSILIDIRDEAHDAGLRPNLGRVEFIVATLSEARDGDPIWPWDDEPDNWSKVILSASGEAGWIQLHDLLDGFTDTGIPADNHKRLSAIEWAESWMNARERQLCQPATVDPGAIDRAAERAAERVARSFGVGDNGNAKPPAPPADIHESTGPALTASQSRVLKTMAMFDTSKLLSSKMIADETEDRESRPPTAGLSEETVRLCVGKLIKLNLAERPEGERSGARLTTPGRKLAGKIAD